ncbi:MAG: hypothetical protein KC652_08060 [Cyanobacteria bacterium HKST-UBA01]|nr:hypothetical protein [Cyanobacteria bacterium HKST-UBA01]
MNVAVAIAIAPRVREHIYCLPDDCMFATRELLFIGKRSAIDMELHKLVKAGTLRRITRGVFKKNIPGLRMPEIQEVAEFKAGVFKKKIGRHGVSAALQIQLLKEYDSRENEFLFYTSGSSSRLKYGKYTIRYVRACPRKLSLPDTDPGDLLKAIWFIGERNRRWLRMKVHYLLRRFQVDEYVDFRQRLKLMPSWIYTVFYPS